MKEREKRKTKKGTKVSTVCTQMPTSTLIIARK